MGVDTGGLIRAVCRGQWWSVLVGVIERRERRRVASVCGLSPAAIEGIDLPPAATGDRADTTSRALIGTQTLPSIITNLSLITCSQLSVPQA